jgi:hypothetical protein
MPIYRGEIINRIGTSRESQTALAGQTVFTLSDISYAVNSNSLRVFVNGIRYYPPDIQELSSTAVGFVVGLEVGDNVLFEVVS